MNLAGAEPALACGFCVAGPTLYLWPFLLVWAAVFCLWSFFRRKYDYPPGKTVWLPLLLGVLILFLGSVFAVALWSIFLLAWVGFVWKALLDRLDSARSLETSTRELCPDDEASREALAHAHGFREAARFQGQTLALLACGCAAAGIRHYLAYGELWPR